MKESRNQENVQDNLADILHQFAQFMPGGVFCYDVDEKQEFLFVSDSMPGMFGYTKEEFTARFHNRFPEMIYVEDRERVLQEIAEQIHNGNNDYCMYRVEMADGSLKWIYDRGRVFTDKNGKRWFCVVIVDADELQTARQRRTDYEKQLLDELRNQTGYDIMTGLLNRHPAVASIERAIQKNVGGTLILLNIDHSETKQDRQNYRYDNPFLKDVAFSIRQLVHPEEILAYFGENKFIIFMPGKYNRKSAEKRAAELCSVIQEVIDSDIKNSRCSIGIAIAEDGTTSFDELLAQADSALYCMEMRG